MDFMKLFVIVVTYKGHRWYERCFLSLRESNLPIQTIVIDNASNDGTVEYIRENFPEIHLIESKDNLGFGRANNVGMRYALDHGCDYVFLLNQDAWIEPNTLEELVYMHKKYPEYGILSPMHMTADYTSINALLDDGKKNTELLSDLYCNNLKEVYEISYINAAAWLIAKKTLDNIGGFCPLFFYTGEDDDYMNRLRFHKIKMGLCPTSRIVHDTRIRLSSSKELIKQSNIDCIEDLLDINIDINFIKLRLKYLKKLLKGVILLDNKIINLYLYKIKILRRKSEFIKCRNLHKIKQSNWL